MAALVYWHLIVTVNNKQKWKYTQCTLKQLIKNAIRHKKCFPQAKKVSWKLF